MGGKQNNLNYSRALSLSGHPFNRIITSLFIRAGPGRYITSPRRRPAPCDKRLLLGMWGGRAGGLACAPVDIGSLSAAGSHQRASLRAYGGSEKPAATTRRRLAAQKLGSQSDTTPSRRGPRPRGDEREAEGERDGSEKASIIQHGPRPLHTHAIKNRKSIEETNGF